MPESAIGVTPYTTHIGAEITGVDLSQPLGEFELREIKAAMAQYQVDGELQIPAVAILAAGSRT